MSERYETINAMRELVLANAAITHPSASTPTVTLEKVNLRDRHNLLVPAYRARLVDPPTHSILLESKPCTGSKAMAAAMEDLLNLSAVDAARAFRDGPASDALAAAAAAADGGKPAQGGEQVEDAHGPASSQAGEWHDLSRPRAESRVNVASAPSPQQLQGASAQPPPPPPAEDSRDIGTVGMVGHIGTSPPPYNEVSGRRSSIGTVGMVGRIPQSGGAGEGAPRSPGEGSG